MKLGFTNQQYADNLNEILGTVVIAISKRKKMPSNEEETPKKW